MVFEVAHTTRFKYREPVGLEPMTIRLRPRADRAQQLRWFEMKLDPAPAGSTEMTDLEGNDVTRVWFDRPASSLLLTTRLTAETLRSNPFDYLVLEPARLALPMSYPHEPPGALDRYRVPSGDLETHTLACTLMDRAGHTAADFLTLLTTRLAEQITQEVRPEGDALPAAQTLERGRGSCRDVAVLFADICRSVGLAARFVSGYQEGDPDIEEKYLHAWAEVYLSGVGWRGYDPSLGYAVADRHLAVAAAPAAQGAAPTEGSYRGNALSTIEADLQVKVLPSLG